MVNILIRFYECETNGYYFQHVDMELELVFRPATMKGKTHRSRRVPILTRNIWGLEGEWTSLELIDLCSSTISNGI